MAAGYRTVMPGPPMIGYGLSWVPVTPWA
jgi:hypothetical protein